MARARAFDTLTTARDLEAAGLKGETAEAVARVIRATHGEYAGGLGRNGSPVTGRVVARPASSGILHYRGSCRLGEVHSLKRGKLFLYRLAPNMRYLSYYWHVGSGSMMGLGQVARQRSSEVGLVQSGQNIADVIMGDNVF